EVRPACAEILVVSKPFGAERVVAARRAVYDAPFAGEQPRRLQAAEQRVEGPFLDRHALFRQGLSQRVSVLGRSQLRQHGESQHTAAQLDVEFSVRRFARFLCRHGISNEGDYCSWYST